MKLRIYKTVSAFSVGIAALAFLAGVGRSQAGYFDGKRYPILTDAVFTADELILDQARFWFAIYVEVGDDEGLLHDPFYPELVFRKVSAPGQGRPSSKLAEAHVHQLRDEIRAMLAKDTASWTSQDRDLRAAFPAYWDSTGIMLSADRIRFQRGLKSKYRAGLERSYRYLPLVDSIFLVHGLPERLRFLPHVESSFYPYAYSKVGAAGMWQFMKSSAKRFQMKVGYEIDERRDPHASTQAAARMLMYNFNWLKSWPLAIVAYNHGPGGMAVAARQTGTRDLGTIIKSYYSNSFGFASKNFYAEFLAASSIAMQADSIFPDLRKMEPLQYQYLVLSKPLGTKYLCTATGLTPAVLEEYNLGLRPATFKGNGKLPKGFALRLPLATDLAAVAGKLGGQMPAGSIAKAAPPVTDTLPKEVLAMASPQDKVGNTQGSPAQNADQARQEVVPKPQAALTGVGAEEVASWKTPRESAREKVRDRLEARADEHASDKAPAVPPVAASRKALPKPIAPAPTATKSVPQSAVLESPVSVSPASSASPESRSAASGAQSPPSTYPPATLAASAPDEHIVDPALALQSADLDKLAHPMDRFNPDIYKLEYEFADGVLSFLAGTEETLSHYSEWGQVPEKTLRTLNRIRNPKDFRIGRRIRIPLSEEKAKAFRTSREEYYRAIEEDFYGNYYVSVTEPLKVEKGMNLWTWSQEREIPFWLLQKHNPGKALNELHPGDTLNLPMIENGIRKWGFTRYGNTREYLSGISRYLATGKPEPF
ncbi:MAG: transglycosylase SLT domain-containing protein [Fibrobacteria bacterium]